LDAESNFDVCVNFGAFSGQVRKKKKGSTRWACMPWAHFPSSYHYRPPHTEQVTDEAMLAMAATTLAHRFGIKIPSTHLFIGAVDGYGCINSYAAGSLQNFHMTFKTVQRLYDDGVRVLLVSEDLLPVVHKLVGTKLPDFNYVGVATLMRLAEFLFELMMEL
jgi:hypothetical protein